MRHLAIAALALLATSSNGNADTYVRGHVRQDGTYVAPHYRTNPDNSRLNNYGTQGNYNPYTGAQGTVDPYKPSNPYGSNGLGSSNSLYGGNRRW